MELVRRQRQSQVFFRRREASIYVPMSVGRSVGRLVGRSSKNFEK